MWARSSRKRCPSTLRGFLFGNRPDVIAGAEQGHGEDQEAQTRKNIYFSFTSCSSSKMEAER